MLEERSARAMDDAFGNAGGARGIEDIERVIEGQLRELDRLEFFTRNVILIGDSAWNSPRYVRRGADIVDDDRLLDARQLFQHRSHLVGDRDGLAIVVIAVAGDEEARLDLAETVEDALLAEIGRAGRPDAAERGDGEESDDRLRHVGHDGR